MKTTDVPAYSAEDKAAYDRDDLRELRKAKAAAKGVTPLPLAKALNATEK